MGDPPSIDKNEELLRTRARERIASGELPRAKPARSWGGRGSGLACSLCDQPIADTGPEMELEFDGTASATTVRFHLQCQIIWDSVRRTPAESGWTSVEKRMPPFDTVVEARVSLSGSRTIILGVVLTRSRGSESVWLNATTTSPLPAAWRPLEWRHPNGVEAKEDTATPRRA